MEKVFMKDGSNGFLDQKQPNWNSSGLGAQFESYLMNSGSPVLPNCNFNPNWENLMDQSDPFESALSSLVSSPVDSFAGVGSGDNVMVRELIGRLGSISNSGKVSPESKNGVNNSASWCSSPLNSPAKINISVMDQQIQKNMPVTGPHPHFPAESFRQTFSGRTLGNLNCQFSSDQSSKGDGSQVAAGNDREQSQSSLGKKRCLAPENAEFGDSREGSSVSEQIPHGQMNVKGQIDANSRKRKSVGNRKRKESPIVTATKVARETDESKGKISKLDGNEEANVTKSSCDLNKKQTKENSKSHEPVKDYIHVRARRGQATDSHSLAERVRREKISERMKFLQDLVPGCNKVTGKAIMLDEIINYVQSLQHQVEFLSMKLATIYPQRMDVNMEKDIFHFPSESSASALPYGYHPQQEPLHSIISNRMDNQFPGNPNAAAFGPNPSMHLPPIDGFGEAAAQVSAFWENDLQNIVSHGS